MVTLKFFMNDVNLEISLANYLVNFIKHYGIWYLIKSYLRMPVAYNGVNRGISKNFILKFFKENGSFGFRIIFMIFIKNSTDLYSNISKRKKTRQICGNLLNIV